jgi:hypothetical protein
MALIHGLKSFRRDNRFESRQNWFQSGQWPRWIQKLSLEFPNLFCLFKVKEWYGMFPYEIVLRDIPFKKKLWARNDDLKFQRGQWPRWNRFEGINDPAKILHESFEFFHNFVIS